MAPEYVRILKLFSTQTKISIVAQACINLAASMGACVGPLIIGGLTRKDPKNGWRDFFVCTSGDSCPKRLTCLRPVIKLILDAVD